MPKPHAPFINAVTFVYDQKLRTPFLNMRGHSCLVSAQNLYWTHYRYLRRCRYNISNFTFVLSLKRNKRCENKDPHRSVLNKILKDESLSRSCWRYTDEVNGIVTL